MNTGVCIFVIRLDYFLKMSTQPEQSTKLQNAHQVFVKPTTEKSFNRQRTTKPGKANQTENETAF